MRRAAVILAVVMSLVLAGPASAAGPNAGRGFLPPNATLRGHSLAELAGAWSAWGFGSPEASNPLLAGRCEPSPVDSKIWFLAVSLGGDYEVDCHVPTGVFLVFTAGGYECSEAEGNGSSAAELRACADEFFADLSTAEVALDGRAARNLERYVVTSPVYQLPGPNLLSDDPSPSLIKGYFFVVHPLAPGTHTLRAFADFASVGFSAGITHNITVGRSR